MDSSGTLLLRLRSISKSFPGVQALKGVDFALGEGECVALLGENGAGKSTLIKVLGGAHIPEAGSIEILGEKKMFVRPNDSLAAGIAIIYQEFNLVPGLSAAENIFLGMEPSRLGWINRRRQLEKSREVFDRIGANLDPDELCENLTVAEKQLVEIAKAVVREARILIMDEPSAALTNQEVDKLHELVEDMRRKGIGIVYVTHRLEEVDRLADRAVIMRDGENVGELGREELERKKIIELMVGRSMDQEFPAETRNPGEVRLRVNGLTRGKKVRNVSLVVRKGEIVSLTGLVGSGRTETVRLLFGADSRESGTIELDGEILNIRNPRDAIAHGVCLLTEDRKDQGLVLGLSVLENFSLTNLRRFSKFGWMQKTLEELSFSKFVKKIGIKVSSHNQLAKELSGGNQQKVILAKWLERNAEILIFDEPTRGIDVGAKHEIYQWMNRLAAGGKGILMISSELPEVLGMSDRIMVMKDGEIVGEVKNDVSIDQKTLMAMAIGEKLSNEIAS